MNRVLFIVLAAVACTVFIGLVTFNGCGKTAKPSSPSDELTNYLKTELKARQTELDNFRKNEASSATAKDLKAQIEKSTAELNAAKEVLGKRQAQLDVLAGELSKKEGRLEEQEKGLLRREGQLDERERKIKEDEDKQRKREEEFRKKAEKDDDEAPKKSSARKVGKVDRYRQKECLRDILNGLEERRLRLETEKISGLGDRMRINNALGGLKRRIAMLSSMIGEEQ